MQVGWRDLKLGCGVVSGAWKGAPSGETGGKVEQQGGFAEAGVAVEQGQLPERDSAGPEPAHWVGAGLVEAQDATGFGFGRRMER